MKIEQKFADDEILNAVKPTPTSTKDVVMSVGCSRRTAGIRLEKLFKEGLICKYEVAAGGSTGLMNIWMKKDIEINEV